MSKPTLCLDFDGVIHSYRSGWNGARVISDPPVDGALKFIVDAQKMFSVAIFSSRSHQFGGIRAIKKWLKSEYKKLAPLPEETDHWMMHEISMTAFADPWEEEVDWAVRRIVGNIQFPKTKPPALVTLDDRAVTFTGEFPTPESLAEFKPWNRK